MEKSRSYYEDCTAMIRLSSFIVLAAVVYCRAIDASCYRDENDVESDSAKYRSSIKIEVKETGEEKEVWIRFPSSLDNIGLADITVFKKNNDDYLFVMPLRAKKEEDHMFAWYVVGPALASHNFIEISYGEPCGTVLRYEIPLPLENAKLRTETPTPSTGQKKSDMFRINSQ